MDDKHFIFQIGKREKHLLFELLKLYPVIPSSYQRLSKAANADAQDGNQKLLEEALAEQRKENKTQLQAMLNEPGRFRETSGGFSFSLDPHQMEWLLQILNDVRVGSWLILGSPDDKKGKRISINSRNGRYLWAMELCGYFESILLAALDGRK